MNIQILMYSICVQNLLLLSIMIWSWNQVSFMSAFKKVSFSNRFINKLCLRTKFFRKKTFHW